MARTKEEILSQILSNLPSWMKPLTPHLAALAAMFAEVEELATSFIQEAQVGQAEGKWLTLLAKGYGVPRGTGESDDLRLRLQNVEDRLTRTAILAAVNRLLAPHTNTEAVLLEWWEHPYIEEDLYLDYSYLSGGAHSFIVVVPEIGDLAQGAESYLEMDTYLDFDAFMAQGIEHPVYESIRREVERLRAAGVVWALVISPLL